MERKIEEQKKFRLRHAEPPLYDVVALNNNTSTVPFVTAVLMDIFDYTRPDAFAFCLRVTENGEAVIGSFPRVIAETKLEAVEARKQEANDPLHVELRRKTEGTL